MTEQGLQSPQDLPDQARAAVGQAGIELHERRSHVEAAFCVLGTHDASHADDRQPAIQGLDDLAKGGLARARSGSRSSCPTLSQAV